MDIYSARCILVPAGSRMIFKMSPCNRFHYCLLPCWW